MKLLNGVDAAVSDWLARNHRAYVHQEPRALLAVVDVLDCIRGAYVITWLTDRTAELSVWGTATPDTTKALFLYAFLGLKVHRLQIHTARTNKRIKRAAPKFGFKFECVARDYYGPGEDALQFAMTPDQCRWINGIRIQRPEEAGAA